MSTHEAKAEEIVERIRRDMFRSDTHPDQARDEHVAAISAALRETEEREREACAKIAQETAEGAEEGYKISHCEHCRDGEIASHNVGYFIVKAIRSRSETDE